MNLLRDKTALFGLGVFVSVLLFTKYEFFGLSLDHETSIGLLTFSGVMLAIKKYFDEKELIRKNQIIDLIAFYRKEVTAVELKVYEAFNINNVKATRLKGDVSTLDQANKKYPNQTKEQLDGLKRKGVVEPVIQLVNILEEFSARVLILSAENERTLYILHDSFIKHYEMTLSFILSERDNTNNMNFEFTTLLYKWWR